MRKKELIAPSFIGGCSSMIGLRFMSQADMLRKIWVRIKVRTRLVSG